MHAHIYIYTMHKRRSRWNYHVAKKEKHVMYVDGGRAMAAMNILKSYLIMEEILLIKKFLKN
jgi:hypothetical protein